jgi:hypothetical protein
LVHLKTRERKGHKVPPEAEKTCVMRLVNPDLRHRCAKAHAVIGILVAFALGDYDKLLIEDRLFFFFVPTVSSSCPAVGGLSGTDNSN